MQAVYFTLLAFGGALCCLNFYLSFLRSPLHRLRGRSRENYQWVSGIPVFGSLFTAVALFGLNEITWARWLAIVLILIDSGGLHYFALIMLWAYLGRDRQDT